MRILIAVIILLGLYRLGLAVEQPAAASVPQSWATDVLAAIGNDRPTAATVAYLEGWHRAEGGTAAITG
jgi:hypothetical protein